MIIHVKTEGRASRTAALINGLSRARQMRPHIPLDGLRWLRVMNCLDAVAALDSMTANEIGMLYLLCMEVALEDLPQATPWVTHRIEQLAFIEWARAMWRSERPPESKTSYIHAELTGAPVVHYQRAIEFARRIEGKEPT